MNSSGSSKDPMVQSPSREIAGADRRSRCSKILIMGLPGAGKTTLARILAAKLSATHFNADEVRAQINKDLGFSVEDRIEQARRMGWLCDRVVESGGVVIADFVCPTPSTREAFGDAFTVWVDRIDESRFADTNKLFMRPERYDIRLTGGGTPEELAEHVYSTWMDARCRAGLPSPHLRSLRRSTTFDRLRDFVTRNAVPRRSDFRFLSCFLLAGAVIAFRQFVDDPNFVAANSIVQIAFLNAALLFGGMTGTLLTFLLLEGVDFFLIEPVFTFGIGSWVQFGELALGSIAAVIIAVAASRLIASRLRG